MHSNGRFCSLIAISISLLSLVQAVPATILSFPVRIDGCVRFKYNSTSAFSVPRFHVKSPTDDIEVFYCNPGQQIPPDEAYPAITAAITEALSYLPEHAGDTIPRNAFQKSSIFRPSRDRVTTFVHTVGGHKLGWLELLELLMEVQAYIGGSGKDSRHQHFHEFEFHVSYDDEKIAVGRFQYVPGRTASQKRF